MPLQRVVRITLIAAALALPLIGCRREPDQPSFEGDMGVGGIILLPTESTRVRADLAKGQADWPPFRRPEERPPGNEDGDDTATAANDEGADIEASLREFITAYNGVVQETTADDVDALLDYYADEQRDLLRPVFEVVAALVATDAKLRSELEKRIVDAPNRLAAVEAALRHAAPYELPVASFRKVTDTTAQVDLRPGSLFDTCSFVLLDQDWYVKAPEGEAPARAQAAAEAALAARQGWLNALRSDTPDVPGVIQAIEAAAHVSETESQDATAPDDENADDVANGGGGD